MKCSTVIRYLLIVIAINLFLFSSTPAIAVSDEEYEIKISLALSLRDYYNDLPISNTSLTATFSLPFYPWQWQSGSVLTNEKGINEIDLTTLTIREYTENELQGMSLNALQNLALQMGISAGGNKNQLINRILTVSQNISEWETQFRRRPTYLRNLKVEDNYTIIKIVNSFIEDLDHEASYFPSIVSYEGFQIGLDKVFYGNHVILECNIWVLEGNLIEVFDRNPVNGDPEPLIVSPAIKADLIQDEQDFGSYYLFPVNYEVTIFHKTKEWLDYEGRKLEYPEDPFSPLRIIVDKNITSLNWISHAADEYTQRQLEMLDSEILKLSSSGYSIGREREEQEAIIKLLTRVSNLYKEGELESAMGGAIRADEKIVELVKWLRDLETMAYYTTIGISFFAYGLASLLSNFFYEEPAQNKSRLFIKITVFTLAMVTFSFSHPSLRIAFSSIVGSETTDITISLLGCFIFGGGTYFFFQIFSIRKNAMSDLSLHLGIRSLKRRRSRTLLTLVTLSIIISASIVFINISLNRGTKIKGRWIGSDISGVLVFPETIYSPLSLNDISWIASQEWCKEISYFEGIRSSIMIDDWYVTRMGMLDFEEETDYISILGIDPGFMENHYNISSEIRGVWEEFFEGATVAIVPTTLDIMRNQEVTLVLEEIWIMGEIEQTVYETLGEFNVVGTYDPATLSSLTKIDNSLFFEDISNLVLIPLNSTDNQGITITEVTVLTDEAYDPQEIAEELAYIFGAKTVSNNNGIAYLIRWSVEFSVSGLVPYALPIIIAGLMVYTTMVSIFEERKKEFSTLATLGLDPKNTFQVFLVEALLIGLLGTFIGFFGSYLLSVGLYFLAEIFGTGGSANFSITSINWSMPAILVALFIGVVLVFLGGYIPAVRAQGLSLMGRVKKREMIGELVSEGKSTTLTLPIRETFQNSELLYNYIRETIGKLRSSFVDSHSLKSELYRDGTFQVSFIALGDRGHDQTQVPCEIRVVREEESLIPVIHFPTAFKTYHRIRVILRDLEEYLIGFSAWKEMQLKMTIIRKAPEKRKPVEEIVAEIKVIIKEIKNCDNKISILEGQKGTLSEEVYVEFREKYLNMIDEKSKNLRSIAVNLEPHHKELHEEILKIEVQVERITTSYNLGEIADEEYIRVCGPLQARLTELNGKVGELEEIFNFLKTPLGRAYNI